MPESKEQKAKRLMKSSEDKKKAAAKQEDLGRKQIQNKVKPGQTGTDYRWGGKGEPLPVGQQRLDIAKRLRQEATRDSTESVRLTKKKGK